MGGDYVVVSRMSWEGLSCPVWALWHFLLLARCPLRRLNRWWQYGHSSPVRCWTDDEGLAGDVGEVGTGVGSGEGEAEGAVSEGTCLGLDSASSLVLEALKKRLGRTRLKGPRELNLVFETW